MFLYTGSFRAPVQVSVTVQCGSHSVCLLKPVPLNIHFTSAIDGHHGILGSVVRPHIIVVKLNTMFYLKHDPSHILKTDLFQPSFGVICLSLNQYSSLCPWQNTCALLMYKCKPSDSHTLLISDYNSKQELRM